MDSKSFNRAMFDIYNEHAAGHYASAVDKCDTMLKDSNLVDGQYGHVLEWRYRSDKELYKAKCVVVSLLAAGVLALLKFCEEHKIA